MIQYIQLFFGFILGQSLMMSMDVYFYQRKKNIEYKTALKAYTKAEQGYFVIAIIGLFVLLFVLSEFVDLSISKTDLLDKDELTRKETIRMYFKTASVLIGMFIQVIAFRVRKDGKAAIDKMQL